MTGPDVCTLFVPQNAGCAAIVLRGVHWQEEPAGFGARMDAGGLPAARRMVRVFAPASAPVPGNLPHLCGAAYLVRGEANAAAPPPGALTVVFAAKCDYGSPALRHWDIGAL